MKQVLLDSLRLRTSALREERVHLFSCAEDAGAAGSEGPPPPLQDDAEVAPGDQLVLWLSEENARDWVSWPPRWVRAPGAGSEEGQADRGVLRRIADRGLRRPEWKASC